MAPTRSEERPRLVDEQILASFDGAVAEYAPAVRERLVHPGLSEAEIRAQFAAIGVQPSREAVAWWRYFDRPSRGAVGFPLEVLPDFQFASVPMSVEEYRAWRSQTEDLADREGWDPDDAWGQAWIPLFGTDGSGVVVLDARGAEDGPSPVRTVRPDTIFGPDHAPVIAPSLGELLAGAVHWMRQGSCRFEPERRAWWPVEAWASQSHAERYALPHGES
jgi:hypothetical protein